MRRQPPSRQRGAVMILVAFAAAVLIGFIGLTVDVGRLFVTKTELQSAMDACALAAAAELRPGVSPPDAQAITRAINAGMTVGNSNDVGFQSVAAGIESADVLFSDKLSDNSDTFPFGYVAAASANPATARYAMCARDQDGIPTWFMHVLESFLGNAPQTHSVRAWAVATLMPSQASCAVPLGLCKLPTAPISDPFQGLTVGQWMTSKLTEAATGSFDWIDFSPPGGGANELAELLKGQGQCDLPPAGTQVGEQGNKAALGKAWNTRFGLYKGSDTPATAPPDYTGYAYTPTSWPSKFNAWSGSDGATPNLAAGRAGFMPYQGDVAAGLNMNGGYGTSTSAVHQSAGADRRLVTAPLVDCSAWAASTPTQQVPILGYACVLLLAPMTNDNGPSAGEEVWLEFRGRADTAGSPCSTSGLGGGTAGPLVPVLVQ